MYEKRFIEKETYKSCPKVVIFCSLLFDEKGKWELDDLCGGRMEFFSFEGAKGRLAIFTTYRFIFTWDCPPSPFSVISYKKARRKKNWKSWRKEMVFWYFEKFFRLTLPRMTFIFGMKKKKNHAPLPKPLFCRIQAVGASIFSYLSELENFDNWSSEFLRGRSMYPKRWLGFFFCFWVLLFLNHASVITWLVGFNDPQKSQISTGFVRVTAGGI